MQDVTAYDQENLLQAKQKENAIQEGSLHSIIIGTESTTHVAKLVAFGWSLGTQALCKTSPVLLNSAQREGLR